MSSLGIHGILLTNSTWSYLLDISNGSVNGYYAPGYPHGDDIIESYPFYNHSACDKGYLSDRDDLSSKYFQTTVYIMYISIFLVALFGNGIVCNIVASSPGLHTVTNFFIFNLAVGDILMSLFCVPFPFVSILLLHYWPFGSVMCHLVNYSQAVSVLVSAYTLVAISVDHCDNVAAETKNNKTIEVVMTSPASIDKGAVYENVKLMIGGHGLFTIGGDMWKMHRKLLNPTIQNYNILNSFYPSFNKNMGKLVKLLEDKVGKGSFNVYNSLEACTLDMICETTFGVKMNIQDGENLSFLDSMNNLMLISGILIFQPWNQWMPIFRLSKYCNIANKSRSEARSYVKKILDAKIKDFKNSETKNECNEVDEFGKRRSSIFIDECVRLSIQQKCFTNEEMITESLTMMAGGFETTAALTSCYIILMLALHPDFQEKVFREMRDIFPDQQSDVTAEDIGKLEYTDRFIKEVMRFTKPVPLLTRYPKQDMKIGTHKIPVGTELILSVFNLHRNPHVWENAGVFDPDHFLPEVWRKQHPFSFVPFSARPRNCIGLKYGNIVIRMFTCWLVRNYRFTTDLKMDQLQFRMNETMKAVQKHMVHAYKRENY